MKLSIVVPALNEEKTIAHVLKKAQKSINQLKLEGEVIVADNNSTDSTCAIASEMGARIVNIKEKGYGNALIGGILAAKGQYIIMGDADDSYDFSNLEPFIEKLDAGYDFVMGSRYKGKIHKNAMPFLHRYIGTPILTLIMNLLFGANITDVNCGMRGFSKKAFLDMNCKATGMEFASEMIIKACMLNQKITEVPCDLYPDKREVSPHLNTWSDGWRHLRFMLLLSPTFLFFVPGFIFSAIGLMGLILLPLKKPLIDEKHLISSVTLLLFGMQILQFGLISKVFSYSKIFDKKNKFTSWIIKSFSLENGIILGLIFLFAGSFVFIFLFTTYYGFINYSFTNELLRFKIAIGGVSAILLGIQIIFTSFVLSLFFIKTK
jgi:glycosyltransferase involved in cell wall biosynthesis